MAKRQLQIEINSLNAQKPKMQSLKVIASHLPAKNAKNRKIENCSQTTGEG